MGNPFEDIAKISAETLLHEDGPLLDFRLVMSPYADIKIAYHELQKMKEGFLGDPEKINEVQKIEEVSATILGRIKEDQKADFLTLQK